MLDVRITAPFGCYTNPVNLPLQNTLSVPTKSGLAGTVSAVYLHPQVYIDVLQVKFLRIPEYVDASFRGVESFYKYKRPKVENKSRKPAKRIRIQQSLIYGLDLVARFKFIPNPEEGGTRAHVAKAEDIFQRRLAQGRCYRLPCAGQQMFPASVSLARGDEQAVDWTAQVGRLPFVVSRYKQTPYWGKPSPPACVENGILVYKPLEYWGF